MKTKPPPVPRALSFTNGYALKAPFGHFNGTQLPAIHLPGQNKILLAGFKPGKPQGGPTIDRLNQVGAELVERYNRANCSGPYFQSEKLKTALRNGRQLVKLVVANWESGNLAEAVNLLSRWDDQTAELIK